MKRMIVLLLVLISFRSYCVEELSAEQKETAWKFIIENIFSKENQLNIFKKDITINLKGEITLQDSVVVKDLIKSFQKAIPHLKIELSKLPGNLILGLNDGKRNKITTNLASNNFTSSMERYFPNMLSKAERKQFIYFHLFHALVFYQFPKNYITDMNGCVFAEKDFQSITFSPYDLYILKMLYAPDFSSLTIENLPVSMQETAWNNIRWKFLETSKKPVIYRTDIAIKLTGNVSQGDSVIMNEVVNKIKMIIPNRKIYLTPEKGNLEIKLVEPQPGTHSEFRISNGNILYKQFDINLSSIPAKEEKEKTLYYYLTRSLFDYNALSYNHVKYIPGSIFDEKDPLNITYHPIDAFVMNKLYADDFQEQFKKQFVQRFTYREYLVFMYNKELQAIFLVLALLIPAILLTRFILKGAFKQHNWNWKEFNKQGLYLIFCIGLYIFIYSLSELHLKNGFLFGAFIAFLNALIAINLIYFAERLIFSKRSNMGASKVIVIFFITFIGITISTTFIIKLISPTSETFNISIVIQQQLLYIFLFAIARSLYIFFNDRYKSIINQKDVELAQMSALHKQAELQSLRAKINPHFLYNALNSIASLATTDGRKTEQMALSLSDFFKYAINREQKQLNTLSEELNAIRTYLEIEKVRFGDRLNFEIACPAELLDTQIPQLLIQPLVENALKHGLSQITEKGLIKVSISKENNLLKIRVYDNGPAFPDGPLSGFGIQNTQERITLIYGTKARINWQNIPEKYIEISLPQNNK